MVHEHLNTRARRVVAGLGPDGRSAIISDADTEIRVAADAFTINQIWQIDSLPPHVFSEDAAGDQVTIAPPVGGFIYLVTTFPPDAEVDFDKYAESLASSGDEEAHVDDTAIAGLHETDTVDIVTVISGEMYAVTETDEVLLKPGDSIVQRGTKHAWSNRSDKPCTIAALMIGATR